MSFLTILLIAITLSMDAFTLSVSYGMFNLRKKEIIKISLLVGIFHFIMPFIGLNLGSIIYQIINIEEDLLIGIIFLILSIDLSFNLFKDDDLKGINSGVEMLLFSFAVSLDSLTVGIALKAIDDRIFLVTTTFMLVSAAFTFTGLLFGKLIKKVIGKKAEIFGIISLMSLAFYYIVK